MDEPARGTNETEPRGWTIIELGSIGLSVEHPSDWEAARDAFGCAVVLAEPGGTPLFTSNLNVSVHEGWAGGLDGFVANERRKMQTYLTDLELADEEDVEIASAKARHLHGSYRQGLLRVVVDQWCVVDGSRAISLSAAAEATQAPRVAPIFERVASSLKISSPEQED